MKKVLSDKAGSIMKEKDRLEKVLKVKLTNRGKEIYIEGEPFQEYDAEKVIEPMRSSGALPDLYTISYGGTADKLTRTRQALMWNFILAIFISYLLMSALFENFF